MGFVSSWLSFPSRLDFPGCTQRLHLPIHLAPPVTQMWDVCVLFRPEPGRLAVLLGDRPGADSGREDRCLAERIS